MYFWSTKSQIVWYGYFHALRMMHHEPPSEFSTPCKNLTVSRDYFKYISISRCLSEYRIRKICAHQCHHGFKLYRMLISKSLLEYFPLMSFIEKSMALLSLTLSKFKKIIHFLFRYLNFCSIQEYIIWGIRYWMNKV